MAYYPRKKKEEEQPAVQENRPVIDLRNDAGFKKYAEDSDRKVRVEEYKKNTPRVVNNELVYPDGTKARGTFAELMSLKSDWLKNNPVQNPELETIQRGEIEADLSREKLKNKIVAEQNPPNISAEQLAMVGQEEMLPNDPLTQSIQENINKREDMNNPGLLATAPGVSLIPKVSNMVVGAINGVFPGSGTALLNSLTENPKARAYLSNYSQKDNYDEISQNVDLAQNKIRLSIKMANQPGNSDAAIKMYNEALAQLRRADAQLKMIEQNDQRAYVDKVKLKRIEVEDYLASVPYAQSVQFKNALLKPDPSYIDGEIEQLLNGGMNNG